MTARHLLSHPIYALVAATLSIVSAALADNRLNCSAYATKAVGQQQQNQMLGCGLKGIGWSAKFEEHLHWCQLPNVKMAHLTEADRIRANAIKKCHRDKKKLNIGSAKKEAEKRKKEAEKRDVICGVYATMARRQYKEAIAKKCGFKGKRWSGKVNDHRAWCLNVTTKTADAETARRAASLKKCSATRLFSRPKVDMRKSGIHGKLPVDVCLSNVRVFCTRKITAEKFCNQKGFKTVEAYSTEVGYSKPKGALATTGPGMVSGYLESKGYCGGQKCRYFTRIICKHAK